MLQGRDELLGQIRRLSLEAGEGRGGAAVILGAPGEGKTAVLAAVGESAGDT
ncbi:MAG: ATP-binding protein [Nocardia sp.]|nr:ATP-binding protein [Nocardia sp.]